MVFGQYGCIMVDLSDEDVAKVFQGRIITDLVTGEKVQTMACLRCFLVGQECYAVCFYPD
jgi:hypothetical protein